MMKFFRKHKKAVSPVIAVMLLVAVAVAAVEHTSYGLDLSRRRHRSQFRAEQRCTWWWTTNIIYN